MFRSNERSLQSSLGYHSRACRFETALDVDCNKRFVLDDEDRAPRKWAIHVAPTGLAAPM